MQRLVLILVGPTAVGKTDVACVLQDRLGGAGAVRLISADSAMVYRGLDIGAAKPDVATLARHPHALIDLRDPEQPYSAADFVADADRQVESAFAAAQLPLIVGGTMLYVKRFVQGIARLPQAQPALRAALEQEFEQRGGDVLHAELSALDPAAAANIHPNNPQRLLRALEVVRLTGQPLSRQWQELGSPPAVKRLAAQVVIYAILPDDRKALHARIAERFDAMLAAGFMDELKSLHARGLHEALPAMRAVGYRQGMQYLDGALSEEEFRDKAITATRRLAKRQLTWLRGWPGVKSLMWGDAEELAGVILQDVNERMGA